MKRKEQRKEGQKEGKKILSKAPGTGGLIREFLREIPLRNRQFQYN